MVGLSREDIIGLYSRNKDIFHSNKLKESLKAMETIRIKSYLDIPSKFTGIAQFLSGTKIWYKEGLYHREDGPAAEYKNGKKEWYKEGKNHRLDGPAIEEPDGTKIWYKEGKLHRLDGPAIELENGQKNWYIEGILYSEKDFNKKIQEINESKAPKMETIKAKSYLDVPNKFTGIAEFPSGTKIWQVKGKYHRLDGPAIEYSSGKKEWWFEGTYHREGGPAIEEPDGTKLWYKKGYLHRLDGPAIELANGQKNWYIEGTLYSEKDFNKKVQELKNEKTMEIKSKEIKQPETKVKTETVFHHSLSGPAVVFDDINKPDEYWVYGVQIFSEELFSAIKTFFDQNDGLDVKRFKSDSEYLVWSNSPERDTFTGIVVCVENKSFDKYVEGCLSSNKGYAQIIADDVAPIFRYALKGDRLSSSKLWKSKKDGVFENDYEWIYDKLNFPNRKNFQVFMGTNIISLIDYNDFISYDFDKKRGLISKEYFNEKWEPSSEEEFLLTQKKAIQETEKIYTYERKSLYELGFQVSTMKVFRNGKFCEKYSHPKTKIELLFDGDEFTVFDKKDKYCFGSVENLKEFLHKNYSNVKYIKPSNQPKFSHMKTYYSINDDFHLLKNSGGDWIFFFPKIEALFLARLFFPVKNPLKKYLEFFIKDHKLNTTPEKLIEQIAENVPEFKEYLEKQITISAKPLFSTKTKEIAKRVAVKRISNIVASLIIQQVFSKVNKAEHQKIKEFFKTEAGVGLVKVLTAQLLPMLEQHLPEKYQHVYRTIAEEFDIQSKVDFSDGILDLILEKVELSSPFISFNFLENLKEDSTGVRVNPLALESPNPDFQAELNAQTATKEEVSAKG